MKYTLNSESNKDFYRLEVDKGSGGYGLDFPSYKELINFLSIDEQDISSDIVDKVNVWHLVNDIEYHSPDNTISIYHFRDTSKYGLHSEFDIQKHKATFTNYLEVIILPTGRVVYAVPSHQEKLISIMMDKYKCSRDEISNMYRDYNLKVYTDFMEWLCNMTNCISVWDNYIIGKPNKFQRHKLEELKREDLYKGE